MIALLENDLARPDTLQLAEWPSEAPLLRPAAQPHVVHVPQCLSDGPLAFVLRVIAALDELGFRQTLVHTSGPECPPPELDALRRVAYVEVPLATSRVAHARELSRVLRTLIADETPATVHVHAVGPGLFERALLAGLPRGCARLFTPHAMPLLNPRRPLTRAVHRAFERLAGLSPNERRLTATLLGYPEDSAGRLMSPEVASLRAGLTAATVRPQHPIMR